MEQSDPSFKAPSFITVLLTLVFGALFSAAMAFAGSQARAADNTFSGCGLGIYGGLVQANGDVGGGMHVGTRGQEIGGTALCDLQMGRFLVGAFVDYSKPFGSIFDLGLRQDFTAGGRVGFVITPMTMVYVHGGRAWWETSTVGNYQGYKVGLGTELRLPTTTPLFLDARYTHATVDNTGPLKVDADEVRVGLTFKFGAGMINMPAPAPLK